jgi:hypothetical protein
MGHLFRTGVVKKMTASIGLFAAKEISTMTLSIVLRAVLGDHPTRRCGNSCATRD